MSEKEQHKEEELNQESPEQKSEETQEIDAETTEKQTVEADPVEKLKDEVQDLKDQNLRLYAEFENFRKRTAKERLQMMDSANKDTLAALLPVLDDFDRALKNTESSPENEAVLEGLKLIQHKLGETLKNKGLIAMESTIGRAFDVEEMEAITQIPASSPELAGKVIDEVEKGYKIGEQVLRYAKVVVGKEA
ncbi:MAG: nucleotide exchange factor GrpE [Cryomorphaceae bacterium]|nr:nucleotide exchange factor GrpE [Cryomorphaceae bacterium]